MLASLRGAARAARDAVRHAPQVWQVAAGRARLAAADHGRPAGSCFIGQLGKYIPGSVWPILTQMELGARANVPRSRSASASILTMILSLVTGLLVAAVTLPFAHVTPPVTCGSSSSFR